MIRNIFKISGVILALFLIQGCGGSENATNDNSSQSNSDNIVLSNNLLKDYVSHFNEIDDEGIVNYVPNKAAFSWLNNNIPLFEAPDSAIQQTYYYRWWTFRKHLKNTEDGYVFTEFIREVGHSTEHNAISCALDHHINEGRWLHNDNYIDEYIIFWLVNNQYSDNPDLHKYSSWLQHSVYDRYLVNKDRVFLLSLMDNLHDDYQKWSELKQLDNGMYWQYDVRDGMEESLSGSRHDKNARLTINSYMYGNAKAMAKIASIAGYDSLNQLYSKKAAELKSLVHENLWDEEDQFFKTGLEKGGLADAREAIGYIPWYFNLPEDKSKYAEAWKQINNKEGFDGKWGLTTAEIRHPQFMDAVEGECEWDGAIWPFATTQTLKGLSNLLTDYENHSMEKADFYDELKTYAKSHVKDGQPYIGEYMHPETGKWLKGESPRSKYYNHSGFNDLIINDLVGLKPHKGDTVEVDPLIPEGKWDWFCLDKVPYHGHMLTILWDKTGEKYNRGKGFQILVDGKEIYQSDKLERAVAEMPATPEKYRSN